MKTVLLDQKGGELHFNQKFLEFAAYYGFVPRVCRPYRPETKGKIESTVRFVKQNFWPGIGFDSLPDLNQQARVWMEKVNHQPHATTRAVPYQRLAEERGVMVSDRRHYAGLAEQRRPRGPAPPPGGSPTPMELTPGPGVGRGFLAPEVEQRSLAVYEEVADVAAI